MGAWCDSAFNSRSSPLREPQSGHLAAGRRKALKNHDHAFRDSRVIFDPMGGERGSPSPSQPIAGQGDHAQGVIGFLLVQETAR